MRMRDIKETTKARFTSQKSIRYEINSIIQTWIEAGAPILIGLVGSSLYYKCILIFPVGGASVVPTSKNYKFLWKLLQYL